MRGYSGIRKEWRGCRGDKKERRGYSGRRKEWGGCRGE